MGKITKVTVFTILVVTVGFCIYQFRRAAEAQIQLQAAQQQSAPLATKAEQITQERDQATRQVATLRGEMERLNQNARELARLRGEMAQLRRSAQELSNQFAVVAATHSPATKPALEVLQNGILDYRLEFEAEELISVALQLASICRYILEHYDRFQVTPEIYGDLRPRFEALEQSFLRPTTT